MQVLTMAQAAKLLLVSPRTVSKWFDSGRLKGYRIPGSQDRRTTPEYLEKFCKEHGLPVPPELVKPAASPEQEKLEQLERRIKELAIKIAPDYPEIETLGAWQQLYAIEQSHEGTELALGDWRELVRELQTRLELSDEETVSIALAIYHKREDERRKASSFAAFLEREKEESEERLNYADYTYLRTVIADTSFDNENLSATARQLFEKLGKLREKELQS